MAVDERMDDLQDLGAEQGWNRDAVKVEWVDARGAPVASVDGFRYTDTVIGGKRPIGLFEIVDNGNGSFENRPVRPGP